MPCVMLVSAQSFIARVMLVYCNEYIALGSKGRPLITEQVFIHQLPAFRFPRLPLTRLNAHLWA